MSAALALVPATDPHNLTIALKFARAGIYVLPCRPNKKPYKGIGSYDASTAEHHIRVWWRMYPDALAAISCGMSGLIVIDCDKKEGIDGEAAFLAIAASDVSGCPVTRTISGGVHCYYAVPPGMEPSNATGGLPVGIDVRGATYVVAPGCLLPDGKRYSAIEGTPDLADAYSAGRVPILPDALRARLTAQKPAGKLPGGAVAVPGPQPPATVQPPPGTATARELAYAKAALDRTCANLATRLAGSGRNQALNDAALAMGEMVAACWIERSIVEAALFMAACQNGYVEKAGERQAHATMQSGIAAGMRQPRAPLQDVAILPSVASYAAGLAMLHAPATPGLDGEHATSQENMQPMTNPYTPPPGLMGEIAKYIYDAAPRQVPEIALAGAIGWMAGFAGRAYNINGAGLNLYVAMLASSGTGKEAINKGYGALITSIKKQVPCATEFIGPTDFASPTGLLNWLTKRKSMVSVVSEFGIWLEQMLGDRPISQRAALKGLLLQLFGKSGRHNSYGDTAYADSGNNIEAIASPSLSLVGESTPSTFFRNISQATIEDGFLPRFIIVEYEGDAKPINRNAQYAVVSTELASALSQFAAHCLTLNGPAANGPCDVIMEADARSRLDALDDEYTSNANATDNEGLKNLWSRVWLNVAKLAALVAVGCDTSRPVVTLAHVTWAENLVTHSVRKIIAKIESGEVAGSDEEKQWQAFTKALREVSRYDADRAAAYSLNMHMVKARVINTKWLNQRVSKLASFRRDRNGPTAAIRRVLDRAIAEELLMPTHFELRVSGGGRPYQLR